MFARVSMVWSSISTLSRNGKMVPSGVRGVGDWIVVEVLFG